MKDTNVKESKKDVPYYKWLLTINNPQEKGYTHDNIIAKLETIKGINYYCFADEIGGETHTYHTHIFIYRKSGIRFTTLQKIFPKVDLRKCNGTAFENRDYVKKEGKYLNSEKALTSLKDTFIEYGECPDEKQGKRNDLITLYNLIKDGKSDFEILEENPYYMEKLNTISKVRELQLYEQFKSVRRLDMRVEYWTGASGQGKTRKIMDKYGDYNVYRVTDTKHPWDMYRGQDIVVFEEFYSERYELPDMLNWLDIYPLDLPCRYNNKTACYTKVFITSNKPLQRQYEYIQKNEPESWKAFLRRIHAIKVFNSDGHIKDYVNLEDMEKNHFINLDSEEFKQMQIDIRDCESFSVNK